MAILAYLGGIQPSEYRQMPWTMAASLAKRLLKLHETVRKDEVDTQVELVKGQTGALARVMGARF